MGNIRNKKTGPRAAEISGRKRKKRKGEKKKEQGFANRGKEMHPFSLVFQMQKEIGQKPEGSEGRAKGTTN